MRASLRLFPVAAFVLLLLYALIPFMMLVDTGLARTLILKNRPGLSGSELQFATVAVKIFTAVIHLFFMGLTIWLSIMVLRRRKWARPALTALLVTATFGSFSSWMAGPALHPVIIATTFIHIVLIVFLWLPGFVGTFPDENSK